MEKILEEMMEYICDKRCRFPNEAEQEELDEICDQCAMNGYMSMLETAQMYISEESREAGYKHGYLDGYVKAVEEFAEKLKAEILPMFEYYYDYQLWEKRISKVAEQLKGDKE